MYKPIIPRILFLCLSLNLFAGEVQESDWLIMLYQDADDYQLEEDIFIDLNEAELAGSTEKVTIISQCDRYKGSFAGDGDWSSTKRLLLKQDNDLEKLNSRLLKDMGELNMAEGEVLKDFALWAIKNYPAKHYALILSDHGMGWPGGWTDPDPDEGDMLWMFEMAESFAGICSETGIGKLDLIGFDACLMGHLEVFTAVAPYCRYIVASQETEPGIGWAYGGFLGELKKNPGMDGEALAKSIVASYIDQDATLTVRAYGKKRSTSEMVAWMSDDITLSAVKSAKLEPVNAALDNLVSLLKDQLQENVAKARAYTQSFTNVFDSQQPPSYLDLGHFTRILIKECGSPALTQGAEQLLSAIDQAVIAEKHGPGKPGATGISLYFPNSELYQADWGGMESYTYSVPSFTARSLWDEFMHFHYTGTDFPSALLNPTPAKPTPAVVTKTSTPASPPPPTEPPPPVITAPGQGKITITNFTLESESMNIGDTLLLSADISGTNIAYIYLFVGYYDEDSDSILIADKDFIEADGSTEISGIYYPDWSGEKSFSLEFDWEPILFSLDDGKKEVFCLLEPVDYGRTADDAKYYVEGEYRSADGKDSRPAQIYFDAGGQIISIYGFSAEIQARAPHEIRPRRGDRFTVLETWIEETASGTEYVQEAGGTITFGTELVEWYDFDAYAGEYILGFILEDFDGNLSEAYGTVIVN